jgi:hypothetical protein
MADTQSVDRLLVLRLAASFVENSYVPAIVGNVKNVSPALLISTFRNCSLYYKLSVTGHVNSINGVYYYRIKWFWELDNITNTFWITEQACKNKCVIEGIVFYKKINKL